MHRRPGGRGRKVLRGGRGGGGGGIDVSCGPATDRIRPAPSGRAPPDAVRIVGRAVREPCRPADDRRTAVAIPRSASFVGYLAGTSSSSFVENAHPSLSMLIN